MTTEQELKETIDAAQSKLFAIQQQNQLDANKQNRIAQVESARAAVERTIGEIAGIKEKIAEAAQKLDDAIKERLLSRQNYSSMDVSTKVNNTAQQYIGLKDALLRKLEQRDKFAARHAELVRVEESCAPKV